MIPHRAFTFMLSRKLLIFSFLLPNICSLKFVRYSFTVVRGASGSPSTRFFQPQSWQIMTSFIWSPVFLISFMRSFDFPSLQLNWCFIASINSLSRWRKLTIKFTSGIPDKLIPKCSPGEPKSQDLPDAAFLLTVESSIIVKAGFGVSESLEQFGDTGNFSCSGKFFFLKKNKS